MHKWLSDSLLAVALLVPMWILINFFGRNWKVPAEVIAFWYFPAVAVGILLFGGTASSKILTQTPKVIAAIIASGITIGSLANLFLFRAIPAAPNPGLPIVLASAGNVVIFFATAALAAYFPKYFEQAKFDPLHGLGAVLICAGVGLIAYRR